MPIMERAFGDRRKTASCDSTPVDLTLPPERPSITEFISWHMGTIGNTPSKISSNMTWSILNRNTVMETRYSYIAPKSRVIELVLDAPITGSTTGTGSIEDIEFGEWDLD